MEDQNLDIFEKFLQGQLSEQERLQFEENLEKDEDYKLDFLSFKFLYEQMQEEGRKERQEKLQNIAENYRKEHRSSGSASKWIQYAAAASIILLVTVGLYYIFKKNIDPNENGLIANDSTKVNPDSIDPGIVKEFYAEDGIPGDSLEEGGPNNGSEDFSGDKNASNESINVPFNPKVSFNPKFASNFFKTGKSENYWENLPGMPSSVEWLKKGGIDPENSWVVSQLERAASVRVLLPGEGQQEMPVIVLVNSDSEQYLYRHENGFFLIGKWGPPWYNYADYKFGQTELTVGSQVYEINPNIDKGKYSLTKKQ